MKYQSNRNYNSNDDVMTPVLLCDKIINHFKPTGKFLEPCAGSGNFLSTKYLENYCIVDYCEIKKGRDFFDYKEKVNWIITNPPWSQIRKFLQHGMKIANNIVFLMTINHLWTKARLRDIKENKFGIKEILMIDTPKEFPQMGFQVGAIHLQKNYKGDIKLNTII